MLAAVSGTIRLTYHRLGVTKMADRPANPDKEIEITPAMIEAGVEKTYYFDTSEPMSDEEKHRFVVDIFKSMLSARSKSLSAS